jgi:hypothetical protein
MKKGLANRDNDSWLLPQKYGELGREVKFRLIAATMSLLFFLAKFTKEVFNPQEAWPTMVYG